MARERNPDLNFVCNIFKLEPKLLKRLHRFAKQRDMTVSAAVRLLFLQAISQDFDPKTAEKIEVQGFQVRLSKDFDNLIMAQVRRFGTSKQEYFSKVAERYLAGKDSK